MSWEKFKVTLRKEVILLYLTLKIYTHFINKKYMNHIL